LKEWRAKRAKELDLRTYNIISNKMMLDLSQILPQTATELKLVKGLGVKRIQNYGNDILNIISRYRKDKDISGTQYSIL
jgi:ATP-dependent DNA helicase RecQ